MLEPEPADNHLRAEIFNRIPREESSQASENIDALVSPPDDVYFSALNSRYRSIRKYLPSLLKHIQFGSSPAGESVAASNPAVRFESVGGKRNSS